MSGGGSNQAAVGWRVAAAALEHQLAQAGSHRRATLRRPPGLARRQGEDLDGGKRDRAGTRVGPAPWGCQRPTADLAHRPEAARLLLAARLVEALALGRRDTLARHLRVFGESICIKGAPRRPAAAAGSPRPAVVERKALTMAAGRC